MCDQAASSQRALPLHYHCITTALPLHYLPEPLNARRSPYIECWNLHSTEEAACFPRALVWLFSVHGPTRMIWQGARQISGVPRLAACQQLLSDARLVYSHP